MANGLSFTVTCVDKATATMNQINNTVNKMTRPWGNLAKSVSQFGKVSGFTQLGKTMGKATHEAGKLARTVGTIAAPMAALIGGGTLAGLYELAAGWARLGAETSRTAQILGISAQGLDTLRNAGTLAGVSAETMTSGFKSFADTLQNAKYGRDQGAFAMLQYLGIQLKETKTGAIDAQAALGPFADKIVQLNKRDPAAARVLAAKFGVEGLMSVLLKGGDGIDAFMAEANRLRGIKTPEMFDRADSFALSLNKMHLAVEGVKDSIADKLIPVIQPLIEKWTEWLVKNRELIGQKVAKFVERIAKAIDEIDFTKVLDGIGKFATWCVDLAGDIDDAVKSMGGWKTAIEIVGVVMAASFLLPMVSATAQIALLIGKLGILAASYAGVGTAASVAGAAMALKWAGGVGAAGAAGWWLGSKIHDNLSESTNDKIGKGVHGLWRAFTGGEALPGDLDYKAPALSVPEKAAQQPLSLALATPPSKDAMDRVSGWRSSLQLDEKEDRYKLPRGLLSGIMMQESRGDPNARSRAGAQGLFQFMPATAKEYGIDAFNPAQSAEAAAKKMAGLMKRYNGDQDQALAAYNYGEGNLAKHGMGDLPAETQGYYGRVQKYQSMFAKKDGTDDAGTQVAQVAQAPQINVNVQTKVDSQGGVRTRVETPGGVKIGYTSPVMAGA